MAKTMSAFYDMPPWMQQMEKLHRQLEARKAVVFYPRGCFDCSEKHGSGT